jgi:hypothetical protein
MCPRRIDPKNLIAIRKLCATIELSNPSTTTRHVIEPSPESGSAPGRSNAAGCAGFARRYRHSPAREPADADDRAHVRRPGGRRPARSRHPRRLPPRPLQQAAERQRLRFLPFGQHRHRTGAAPGAGAPAAPGSRAASRSGHAQPGAARGHGQQGCVRRHHPALRHHPFGTAGHPVGPPRPAAGQGRAARGRQSLPPGSVLEGPRSSLVRVRARRGIARPDPRFAAARAGVRFRAPVRGAGGRLDPQGRPAGLRGGLADSENRRCRRRQGRARQRQGGAGRAAAQAVRRRSRLRIGAAADSRAARHAGGQRWLAAERCRRVRASAGGAGRDAAGGRICGCGAGAPCRAACRADGGRF